MGKTPRAHVLQLPMPTRSSEAGAECWGRVVLSYVREQEKAEASFFTLGDLLHQAIENAINLDMPMTDNIAWGAAAINSWRAGVDEVDVLTGSQRDVSTMIDDFNRMITNWYAHVHPDSDKRHPVYDEYDWPPITEQKFLRLPKETKYPVWGSIDAVFMKRNRIRIVDWKSGRKRPGSDFQLNYYRFGAEMQAAQAHYHMLDRIRKPSIVLEAELYPGDEEILKTILLTEERKDAILRGEMPEFRPDWYCNYCPVQHLCPTDGPPHRRDMNERELKKLIKDVVPMSVLPGVQHHE